MPSRETTCLNKVFRLKNVSNFTYDDIILSSSKSIKMNVLNNHLNVMKGHVLLFFFLGFKCWSFCFCFLIPV